MKNTKVLEMITNGEIELLKSLLMEEIYQDSLKTKGNAKQRYNAMKRYFKYKDNIKEMCNYPCKDIEVNGKLYNSFLDGYCFALTTESVDTLETYDKAKGEYFNIQKFVDMTTAVSTENIDINGIFAELVTKGYKYKKSEFKDINYVIKYKDSYYNACMFDKAFAIIDDGNPAEVSYSGKYSVLLIQTSIGIAGVLPFRWKDEYKEIKTILDMENFLK